MTSFLLVSVALLGFFLVCAQGASKDKPHGHKGILEVYNGKPLPIQLDATQKARLDKGEAVSGTLLSRNTVSFSDFS